MDNVRIDALPPRAPDPTDNVAIDRAAGTASTTLGTLGPFFGSIPFRTVTGTTDTIIGGDLGGAVVYSSNSAIALSLITLASSLPAGKLACLTLLKTGTGTMTVTTGTGVSVVGIVGPGGSFKIPGKTSYQIMSADGLTWYGRAMQATLSQGIAADDNSGVPSLAIGDASSGIVYDPRQDGDVSIMSGGTCIANFTSVDNEVYCPADGTVSLGGTTRWGTVWTYSTNSLDYRQRSIQFDAATVTGTTAKTIGAIYLLGGTVTINWTSNSKAYMGVTGGGTGTLRLRRVTGSGLVTNATWSTTGTVGNVAVAGAVNITADDWYTWEIVGSAGGTVVTVYGVQTFGS